MEPAWLERPWLRAEMPLALISYLRRGSLTRYIIPFRNRDVRCCSILYTFANANLRGRLSDGVLHPVSAA